MVFRGRLVRTKQYSTALGAYDRALAESASRSGDSASRALILRNRSFCLINVAKHDEALRDAEEAIALQPENTCNHWRKVAACEPPVGSGRVRKCVAASAMQPHV